MAVVLVLVVIAIVLAIWLLGSALLVGLSGAMFFDRPFADGWDLAWDHLGYLVLFGIIAGFVYGGSSRSVTRS